MSRSIIFHFFLIFIVATVSSSEILSAPDVFSTKSVIADVITDCNNILKDFKNNFSDFTSCLLQKTHPIGICLNCDFQLLNDTYSSLKKYGNGTCVHQFFESSSLCIIDALYNNVLKLWTDGNCEVCHNSPNDTASFFEAWNSVNSCLNDILNNAVDERKRFNCTDCQEGYKNLTKMFEELTKKHPQMCVDVTDAMNSTVRKWDNLKCRNEFGKFIGAANIVAMVLVILLPLVFYSGAKWFSAIENVKLFYPKRRSSLHPSMHR